jgi:hypothetical protein
MIPVADDQKSLKKSSLGVIRLKGGERLEDNVAEQSLNSCFEPMGSLSSGTWTTPFAFPRRSSLVKLHLQ